MKSTILPPSLVNFCDLNQNRKNNRQVGTIDASFLLNPSLQILHGRPFSESNKISLSVVPCIYKFIQEKVGMRAYPI